MKKQLTVIVACHKKLSRLELTLEALMAQNIISDCNLIIVADGASEQVKSCAHRYSGESVKVIESPGLGRSGARNLGARAAQTEFLLFLDDDILTRPDFLQLHLEQQNKQPGYVHGKLRELIGFLRVVDPKLGAVGAPPVLPEQLASGQWRPDGYRLMTSKLERAAEMSFSGEAGVRVPWLAGAGANLSIPKALWQEVGGFDESFGLKWGMEDIDFAYRVYQASSKLYFNDKACGYHMSHYEENRWLQQDDNLQRFLAKFSEIENQLLSLLLSANGTPQAYFQALREKLISAPESAAAN
ncbi:MAG: glycosyltransferase family 2 protein [Aestuariibacter sp.]